MGEEEAAAEMVVVDSSAVVAIFKRESDAPQLAERLASYANRTMAAPNFLEAAIVCERWARPSSRFDEFFDTLHISVVAATFAQMQIARDAYRRFGKGRGAKAALNFGDCFAYALAREIDAPLLFKGGDFAQTDIAPA